MRMDTREDRYKYSHRRRSDSLDEDDCLENDSTTDSDVTIPPTHNSASAVPFIKDLHSHCPCANRHALQTSCIGGIVVRGEQGELRRREGKEVMSSS